MASKKAPQGIKRKVILLDVKKEIIRKHQEGRRMVDLSKEYGKSASTISTIIQNKEKILGLELAKGVTRLHSNRPQVIEEVEKLLLLWIQEKQRAGDTLTQAVICTKAKALHDDLLEQQPGTSVEAKEFKASNGWFARFKTRSGIHSMVRHGEAACSDVPAAGAVFLEEHSTELSTEDLLELQREEQMLAEEVEVAAEKMTEEDISIADIKEAIACWEKFEALARKKHPNKPLSEKYLDAVNTHILPAFRGMLKRHQKQLTLDQFLLKKARHEELATELPFSSSSS